MSENRFTDLSIHYFLQISAGSEFSWLYLVANQIRQLFTCSDVRLKNLKYSPYNSEKKKSQLREPVGLHEVCGSNNFMVC